MLARCLADDRGTSTVELAMVAPFLALLILGTVDASRAVTEKVKLQQAATRAMEMASAGGMGGASWSNLAAEAAAAAGVSAQNATVDQWLECNRVRQASFTGLCPTDEEIARYASVTVRNVYSPWFATSLAGLGWNVSRQITIEGEASVRVQ